MPAHGVYFCKIDVQGKIYPGIANVGIKPTVTEEKKLLIEAFLFGYSGNAYGEKVRISLMEFRRPEQKFNGIGALKEQIDKVLQREWNILELYKFLFTQGSHMYTKQR